MRRGQGRWLLIAGCWPLLLLLLLLPLLLLGSCLSRDGAEAPALAPVQEEAAPGGGLAPPPQTAERAGMARSKDKATSALAMSAPAAMDQPSTGEARGEEEKKQGGEDGAAPTRAWFPETFLFEPLVVTDEQGRGKVAVPVPDRLTSWRVLGLAHARTGSQAGAVARFQGTLPAYVDPVLPPFLTAGDAVRLPVLLVNTTDAALTRTLEVTLSGAATGRLVKEVTLPAGSSQVETLRVEAGRVGELLLRASLGDTDAVQRSIPVQPSGRPQELRVGGTLAATRSFLLAGPADLDPASARARLVVYPGPLALLRAELAGVAVREGLDDDAYALLLAGRAPALLAALHAESDMESLRQLTLVATQRVVRHARNPDLSAAMVLAEAALSHPENPVLQRLGERMAATVAAAQRPDGTFGGGMGWTLQRLLVVSAEANRAVAAAAGQSPAARRRAQGVRLRGSAFFERNLRRIEDGYTAAAILASGALDGSPAGVLQKIVREAVQARPDGTRFLPVAEGVVRPDGLPPSLVEATALAVLALQGDAQAASWLPDLGGFLLAGYAPGAGWGDGRSNLQALSALQALFADPLPEKVEIELKLDGRTVASDTFQARRQRDLLVLEAPAAGAAGEHTWSVEARPALPGLGFAFTLHCWTPWKKEPGGGGLELSVELPRRLAVGLPAEAVLAAVAPAEHALVVRHALPAGVQADRPSLEALVQAGEISGFEAEDGAVTLRVPPRRPGQTVRLRYRVIPTLHGTLYGAASSVRLDGSDVVFHLPPVAWKVE